MSMCQSYRFCQTVYMADEKTERVMTAARQVFVRYGFTRTTMGDIAEAAKMSRPALYLVFPFKDDIFSAVIGRSFAEMLTAIREGIGQFESLHDKLTFAFDVWCVRLFELMQTSPEAKDLLDNGYDFARETIASASADFETIIGEVVEPIARARRNLKLSAKEIAETLIAALTGFKSLAKDAAHLRQLIACLVSISCDGRV
jgi:AcrR family transcriptional regulator